MESERAFLVAEAIREEDLRQGFATGALVKSFPAERSVVRAAPAHVASAKLHSVYPRIRPRCASVNDKSGRTESILALKPEQSPTRALPSNHRRYVKDRLDARALPNSNNVSASIDTFSVPEMFLLGP